MEGGVEIFLHKSKEGRHVYAITALGWDVLRINFNLKPHDLLVFGLQYSWKVLTLYDVRSEQGAHVEGASQPAQENQRHTGTKSYRK